MGENEKLIPVPKVLSEYADTLIALQREYISILMMMVLPICL